MGAPTSLAELFRSLIRWTFSYYNYAWTATWFILWLTSAILFSIPVVREFLPVLGYPVSLLDTIALTSWVVFFASLGLFVLAQKINLYERV